MIVCGLFECKRISAGFLSFVCALPLEIVCLYLYFRWRSSYHEWLVGIPLIGLSTPHCCIYRKPTSYVVGLFVLRQKVRGDCSFC